MTTNISAQSRNADLTPVDDIIDSIYNLLICYLLPILTYSNSDGSSEQQVSEIISQCISLDDLQSKVQMHCNLPLQAFSKGIL